MSKFLCKCIQKKGLWFYDSSIFFSSDRRVVDNGHMPNNRPRSLSNRLFVREGYKVIPPASPRFGPIYWVYFVKRGAVEGATLSLLTFYIFRSFDNETRNFFGFFLHVNLMLENIIIFWGIIADPKTTYSMLPRPNHIKFLSKITK